MREAPLPPIGAPATQFPKVCFPHAIPRATASPRDASTWAAGLKRG
jgi:hypothetical protein